MSQIPEPEGIYQLLDKQENIIYIKGAMSLHRDSEEQLKLYEKARYFTYEEKPALAAMYNWLNMKLAELTGNGDPNCEHCGHLGRDDGGR